MPAALVLSLFCAISPLMAYEEVSFIGPAKETYYYTQSQNQLSLPQVSPKNWLFHVHFAKEPISPKTVFKHLGYDYKPPVSRSTPLNNRSLNLHVYEVNREVMLLMAFLPHATIIAQSTHHDVSQMVQLFLNLNENDTHLVLQLGDKNLYIPIPNLTSYAHWLPSQTTLLSTGAAAITAGIIYKKQLWKNTYLLPLVSCVSIFALHFAGNRGRVGNGCPFMKR